MVYVILTVNVNNIFEGEMPDPKKVLGKMIDIDTSTSIEIGAHFEKEIKVEDVENYRRRKIIGYYYGRGVGYLKAALIHVNMIYDCCMC